MHKFLIHDSQDDVGVAVSPISKGEDVLGVNIETHEQVRIKSNADIPLGHKIAIKSKKSGEDLIKYNVVVGEVTEDFEAGDWVHTHNLRTKRWHYGA